MAWLPAEPAGRDHQARHAPGDEDEHGPGLLPHRLPAVDGPFDEVDQVRQRQYVCDRLEKGGKVAGRPEAAGEERHRQDDDVDDCGRALRRADQGGGPEAHPGEADRAEREREQQRRPLRRKAPAVEQSAERHDRRGLEREHEQGRAERRAEVRRGGQRRRADALEDPELAPDHEHDREAAERGVRDAVGDQRGDEVVGVRPAPVLAVVHGREEQEQEHGEEETETALSRPRQKTSWSRTHLVHERAHGASSSSSSR